MKQLTMKEILPVDEFLAVRGKHQAEVLRHKVVRRLQLGDHMTFLFENRTTVRWQVHEMCRVEDIRDTEAVEEELEAYNPLIPGESELSATLLIEYEDETERGAMLSKLLGLKHHMRLVLDGCEPVPGIFEEGREDTTRHRISAVHFVRFPLGSEHRKALGDFERSATIVCDHPAYETSVELEGAIRGALIEDVTAD